MNTPRPEKWMWRRTLGIFFNGEESGLMFRDYSSRACRKVTAVFHSLVEIMRLESVALPIRGSPNYDTVSSYLRASKNDTLSTIQYCVSQHSRPVDRFADKLVLRLH